MEKELELLDKTINEARGEEERAWIILGQRVGVYRVVIRVIDVETGEVLDSIENKNIAQVFEEWAMGREQRLKLRTELKRLSSHNCAHFKLSNRCVFCPDGEPSCRYFRAGALKELRCRYFETHILPADLQKTEPCGRPST